MTYPVILPARLAYITEKEPGRVIIDLHTETGHCAAILTEKQLANLAVDATRAMRNMMRGMS